ncbi:MAG: hypothetical protein ACP5O6_08645 [Candidatus Baltobacteraceae bacterium]
MIERLKIRAAIEKRSIGEIVNESLREYGARHPVSREEMLAMVRNIAHEDTSILKALAD